LFVDLQPNPLRSRRPAFEALDRLVEAHAGERIVLMGDFNTPGDSRHWHGLRKHLMHAFESAGNGLADTWPLPFPVLGLDHVWTSTSIRIAACRQPWWWLSDHRPVIADIEL
jgi:vancomycin resistance protein VanJ